MSEGNEVAEMWHAVHKAGADARAKNRFLSANLLRDQGIVFTEHNYGAHLIVEGKDGYVDFWPGTGRWNNRKGFKGFGVKNLIDYIKEQDK